MLMFHTDSYHIGGEKFQVKADDGHCEFSCTVCLDDEDGLCGTGWLPGSQNKGSCNGVRLDSEGGWKRCISVDSGAAV